MRCCWAAAAFVVLAASPAPAEAPPLGQADTGIGLLARSLAAAEQRLGPTSPALLPMLASLAQSRFERAEVVEATALRRRSLKIAIAAYGSASVPAAEAMAALARLYIERRRYLDAEPLAIAATAILSERLGLRDRALAPVLAERARIALAWGDNREALDWARQAVAIDKKGDKAGEQLPGAARAGAARAGGASAGDQLRTLGAVLTAKEEFEEAERVLRQALALDREAGDPLAAARDLARLAEAYLRQKRYAEALPPIEKAAAIDQDRLAATHPLIAEDFDTIGRIYLETARASEAAKILRAAVAVLEGGPGANTPTLAYVELDLARAEHALGHEEKSQTLFKAAQHILNVSQDEEHDRQRQV